ncbi:MAG TPA: twin-arginine translocase subunit TatC [Gemmataceae bacterium]|nr:twin-arginine translocase subunit TatC [Gemmataceae bacterium]
MPRAESLPDPEDYFAETRMSFGDHIEDLRSHLVRAIAGFVVGMAVAFIFGSWVYEFITAPVVKQVQRFYDHRVVKTMENLDAGDKDLEALNLPTEFKQQVKAKDLKEALRLLGFQPAAGQAAEVGDEDFIPFTVYRQPLYESAKLQRAQQEVGRRPGLSTMNVMEGFMVYIKVCAFTGLVISSPWVFWQIWAFVAAGLYPHEKKYVHKYLPISLGLFLAGVLLCQFMVIPKAIEALLWFNEWLGLEPDLRLNEWLSFALLLPLVFGLSFQTPMVMLFLAKLGILDADSFRKKRRIAWFAMAVFAAIFTPADVLSMLLMWVPMVGLYEMGILMVQYAANPSEPEVEESEELIGV